MNNKIFLIKWFILIFLSKLVKMTDVMGTRAAGGIGSGNVVGQNESGLSKQLKAILTSNAPLLNSPGYVSENDLYYDSNSSSVVAVELQAYYAKDKIVFNSLKMGASPSVYIPSVLFCGTGYWVFELNKDAVWPAGAPAPATHYFATTDGYGFQFIKNVIIYMGASSIASITISGMANMMFALACCESDSKKRIMFYGAGKGLVSVGGATSNSMMAQPAANSSLWRVQKYSNYFDNSTGAGDTIDDNMRIGAVPIRTPFSSMAFLDKRLDFDTKLCTQPIQITLETRAANEVFAFSSNIANQFTDFSNSTFQMWQQELSDKSMSIRNELLTMPNFNTALPFQYMNTVQFNIVPGGAGANITRDQVFTVNLTSIINADLTTFLFMVRNNYRIAPSTAQAAASYYLFNPTYGEELYDIELSLNGQNFFRFDQGIYENVVVAKTLNDVSVIPNNNFNATLNAQNAPTDVIKKYTRGHYYELNNSRLRTIINESRFQNVPRYAQQTFQMRFRINRTKNYGGIPADDQSNFVMDMAYCFNGCLLVGGDGGTTKLITQ